MRLARACHDDGVAVAAPVVDDAEAMLAVNSRVELAAVNAVMRRRLLERLMLAGVTVEDPGTTYVDWIVSSDIKAAAGTVYGDAAAERGTDMAIKYYATAQTVKTQFIAGAGDLANVTGSSGTIYVVYLTLP